MSKTLVTISARGAPGSGKSTILEFITRALDRFDVVPSLDHNSEHSVKLILPADFAARMNDAAAGAETDAALIAHQREVIEKWNEIDKVNTTKIDELIKTIEGQATALASETRARDAANDLRRTAEAARDQAIKEVAELKSRLHEAETELARMRGYVDRVHDLDEIGREPLTTVTERTERPRRGASNSTVMAVRGDGCASDGVRRRHWTSYGQ